MTQTTTDPGATLFREFCWAFAVAALLAVLPLWLVQYLPMIDLPQHMAQLSIGQAWDDPAASYQRLYRVNWVINHVASRATAGFFAWFVPVPMATKLVVSLCVVGLPASAAWLLHRLRANLFWCLPTFLTAFGFAFCWGFFDFMFAVPLALLLIAEGYAYCLGPSKRRTVLLASLAYACFLAHVLALAIAALIVAALIACAQLGPKQRLMGWAAVASPAPALLAIIWATRQLAPPSSTAPPFSVDYGLHRVRELFSFQAGLGDPDGWCTAIGVVGMLLPFLMGAGLSREPKRWVPLGLTLLVFFAIPKDMMGVAFVHGRYAVFVLPALYFALSPGAEVPHHRHALALAVVLGGLLVNALSLRAFDAEASAINPVLRQMKPQRRVLYLATNGQSKVVSYPAYLHFGCYYQVERGGPADFSFAEFFANRYRYREEADPDLPPNVEWDPRWFRWSQHDGYRYDYLLVRGPVMDEWFLGAEASYRVIAQSGPWQALEKVELR